MIRLPGNIKHVEIVAVALVFYASQAFGQRPTVEDFTMSGDTYLTEDECFRLTDELDYSSGSIWYKNPISLREPFSIRLSIMAGCQDDLGADGMVFAFTSKANRVGYRGEGIGYSGLAPSVGIEIDTWLNEHLNDPREDHLAIMINGRVGHWNDLAGPVKIPNIEDCKRHGFYVNWAPTSQTLSIEIDGVEVIATSFDLVNKVFGGNAIVFWGVTAATGRYNNMHEVCFDRIAFHKDTQTPAMQNHGSYVAAKK
ncbi:MAG: hypothetical protein HKN76_17380 [Saprospiraceae bacterium]|nr:hypothetical protein [Saprospiraceae bacterium]